jgi:Secretion system C-terminal sorting domain
MIPAGSKRFKVTLAWNDPPALPNAAKALVNDLDIELENVITGERWKPWVLNSYPQTDSLRKSAERKRDSLNNVEQITLDNPDGGVYLVRVNGFNVFALQDFFLSYQFDSTGNFEWQFPTAIDFVTAAQTNVIRWEPISGSGLLEYSIDSGTSWQNIQTNIDLSLGIFRWTVPNIIQKTLLRMTIGTNRYVSDTFTISTRTSTGVGFNCPDSILFYWKKIPGVKDYGVYALGDQYLEPITVSSDSLIILAKKSNPSLHYAVLPIISGKEGMRSYTFDYSTQGVACYIRSFLGLLDNDTARLYLSLGTLYGVNAIVLEKQIGGQYVTLAKILNPGNLQITFADNQTNKGLNIYRVKLELINGGVVYSQSEIVYYLSESKFIIYPNPVQQFKTLEILTSNDIFTDVNLVVYDTYGKKVLYKTLKNFREQLSTGQLSKGMYIFRFMVKDEKDTIMKVIVQ